MTALSCTRHVSLTHTDLDFWVDVTIHERDERFMATADLGAEARDIGVGDTPGQAVSPDLPIGFEKPTFVKRP